jgi:hypothetical protein
MKPDAPLTRTVLVTATYYPPGTVPSAGVTQDTDLPIRKDTSILSVMENDLERPSREEATDVLNTLSADRERLADGVDVPWVLLVAFGALGAGWVATAATTDPGPDYQPPAAGWLALVGALVIVYLIRHQTGIRFRAMGAGAGWAVTGIVVACLALFSVSLGLVASGVTWAVVLTSLAAFAVTTWLAAVAYRSAVTKMRRD